MSLPVALGQLINVPQFFVWRLIWNAEDGKFDKTPCTPDGPWIIDASQPHNWLTFHAAQARVTSMQMADSANRYALGFWMTADLGYWFLDLDKCIDAAQQYTPIAAQLIQQFAGCFMEFSSSGNGAHIIGKGTVPSHTKKNKEYGLELYTEQRGIAFGLSGQAWGCADVGNPAIASVASLYFPPRAAGAEGEWDKPRADWNGPTDDEALLAKAMASSSVASKMGNRASFAQLWTGAPELDKFYGPGPGNERDAALAAHLAFWTGCDGPRMERLMRRSALARPKWDEHRTYLRELTIDGACARQGDVYSEPRKMDPGTMYAFGGALPALPAVGATSVMVSPEAKKIIDDLLDMVHSSTSWDDVHNRVIPAVRDAGVPSALMSRVENAINKRLDLWDAKLPVAKLRALIAPPRASGPDEALELAVPEWLSRYVYVRQGDRFHDISIGVSMSRTSFNATHNRDMPSKGDSGQREDAVMWALERWGVKMVHDVIYYPGMPAIVEHEGLTWANQYTEASHPAVQPYTDAGVDAINRFMRHLFLLCGQRTNVFSTLVSFMAHNVQMPGKKIRWCPIIKGTHGDGKSMIASVLDAAMGGRNVAMIGPEIVANTGGFTDWAHGNAVVAFEELYMGGKDRHRVANAIKPYISNNKVSVNGKGDKPKSVINTCNQIAFTNNGDAVPIESGQDRRWLVIFTPFENRAQMNAALGYLTDEDAEPHFDLIFDSLKREPGQWRKWLLEWQIPATFSANRAALETKEKESMASNGMDDVESIARSIVEEGAYGVGRQVLSSACLSSAMKQRSFSEGVDIPKGQSMHHLLNRMGFVKISKSLWWNNAAHRVWAKPGIDDGVEALKALLDATSVSVRGR